MLDGNNLLSALRDNEIRLLASRVREVELEAGDTLYEPGDQVAFAYFPRYAAVASFAVALPEGQKVETAMIGREGALGGIVSKGRIPAYAHSVVVHGGSFYRIASSDLEAVNQMTLATRLLFSRYADCLFAQIFQAVACNASHTLEQRIAKWLCATLDRIAVPDITVTQDQLASKMGVGRSYTSRVIQSFKKAGLLRTRRGGLVIRDRKGIEHQACSCNAMVNEHFAAVLGGLYDD